MKKFILTCFYFTLTLAAAAVGFFLPAAASSYQDRQMAAKVEYSKIEPMAFAYSSSLFDTLRLLSSVYYTIEYPPAGSRRAADDIQEIAMDTLEQLKEHGIAFLDSKEQITNSSTLLQLAVSDPKSAETSMDATSAVIWHYTIYTESGIVMHFQIDDKSGKTAGFSVYSSPKNLVEYDTSSAEKIREKFRSFAQDYYGLPAKVVSLQIQTAANSNSQFDVGTTPAEPQYFIQLTEESGDKIQLRLTTLPEFWALN